MQGRNFTISESLFFGEGYIHEIPETVITIEELESCTLGVSLIGRIISYQEDVTLRDPALGTKAYNQPGADRIRWDAAWIKESEFLSNPKYKDTIFCFRGLIHSVTFFQVLVLSGQSAV
jgi:hypothetical protein